MTKEEIRQEALKAGKERFPRCAGDKENSFHGVNSAYGLGFVDGALWMRGYNKSPWISVDEDLPCNHEELLSSNPVGYSQETIFVLVIDITGSIVKSMMVNDSGKWEWVRWPALYWMPIPKLPKNRRLNYGRKRQ